MATGIHVTGPVSHYIGFPGNPTTGYFLGVSKTFPRIRINNNYMPIMMEQSGYVTPFDLSYQGKEGKILTTLNMFETTTAYLMGCAPRYGGGNLALGAGLESYRDTGALLLGDQCRFVLYLQFPFNQTANNPAAEQNAPFTRAQGAGAIGAALGVAAAAINLTAKPFTRFGTVKGLGIPASADTPKWIRFLACVLETSDMFPSSSDQEITLAIHAQKIYYKKSKSLPTTGAAGSTLDAVAAVGANAGAAATGTSSIPGGFGLFDNTPPSSIIMPT